MFGSVKYVIYLWRRNPQRTAHISIYKVCTIDDRIECWNMGN